MITDDCFCIGLVHRVRVTGFITPWRPFIFIFVFIVVGFSGPTLTIVVNSSNNRATSKQITDNSFELTTATPGACTVINYKFNDACLEVCGSDRNQTLMMTTMKSRESTQQHLAIFEKLAPTRLTSDLFTVCPGIQIFTLHSIALQDIGTLAFVNATMLEELVLVRNQLKTLRNNTFLTGPGSTSVLKLLDLSHNQIEQVDSDALKSLHRLSYVDLSGNRLTHFPARLFYDCAQLKTILLRGNHISALELHLSTRALQLLDGSSNAMTDLTLAQAATTAATSVVGNSKRQSNTYQRNVSNLTLILDMNHFTGPNITVSPVFQIHHLSLAGNNLSNLIVLTKIKPLNAKILNLADNDLHDFDARLISSTKLEMLQLNGNKLSQLDVDDLTLRFPRLNSITLSNNDWYCRDLHRISTQLQLRKIKILDMKNNANNLSDDDDANDAISSAAWCFDPQREIIKLKEKYDYRLNQILLIVVATVALLLLLITFITISSCRALQRMRSDSLSTKSFDIKMMPTENIYEEAVYNNVYSNPTTTL